MIDTKALRSRILDLAIQGKLTEQLPSDGTAEELYQQIQAEKQALIKEGKIKKEKPLPEISADEIPFEIPSNWKWVRTKDVFHVTMGQSPDGTSISSDNSGIEFHQGKIYFGDTYLQESSVYTSSPTKIAEKESVLICVRAPVGVANITTRTICIGRGLCAIKPISGIEILFALLSIRRLEKEMLIQSKGTTFSSITGDVVNNLKLPLPPLAEQKRIVERVEEIFRLLDTIDEAQEKYSADSQILKAKLITAGIQGKLTKQLPSDGTAEELYQQIQVEKQKLIKEGKLKKEKPLSPISTDEIPFEIPQNWMWVRLGEIMWNRDSERIPVSVADRKKLKKIYDYYGASGVIDKVEDYLFDKRLLLIGEDGANLLSRSTPIAFMADGKYWVNNHAHVLDCYIENYLDFVMYYINAISLVPYVTGSAQPKLNQDRMNKIPIPLPPLAEQKRIADVLERVLGEIDNK